MLAQRLILRCAERIVWLVKYWVRSVSSWQRSTPVSILDYAMLARSKELSELEISLFLLRRLLGVRTEDKKQTKVSKFTKNELLLINIGSTSTGGRVLSVKGNLAKIQLTSPACTEVGKKVALSRRIEKHWRFVGKCFCRRDAFATPDTIRTRSPSPFEPPVSQGLLCPPSALSPRSIHQSNHLSLHGLTPAPGSRIRAPNIGFGCRCMQIILLEGMKWRIKT